MRWIVFDYGEVISRRPTTIADLAIIVDADREAFESAYWDLRRDYDRGWRSTDYWRSVSTRSGGKEPTESEVAALTDADVDGWLATDSASVELINDLVADGHPLALLSNAPVDLGDAIRRQPWAKHFEHILISAEYGVAKPDEQIWTTLVERLAAEPADCLFLDDRQVNVDAAIEVGIQAHRWTGAAAAREVIDDFLARR